MPILQPYAKFILARGIGRPGYTEISVSASADISLDIGSVRIGTRASATLGRITAVATGSIYNVTATADIGLSLGTIRLGSKASANIILGATSTVSSQVIVHGSAVLPLISMGQRILASAVIPPLSVVAVVSTTSTATSVAWITNLSLEETTKFTNFGFSNLLRIGNEVYGVKSDGLYLLDGLTTDNGTAISSYIKTHPQNYGRHLFKRIPYMYIQTAYPIAVTSYIDSTTEGPMTTDHGEQKVTMSKGTQGYYWSFKVANVAPNSFKIDGIEPFIDYLKRRA